MTQFDSDKRPTASEAYACLKHQKPKDNIHLINSINEFLIGLDEIFSLRKNKNRRGI